ncbi:MAG: class I SAM-dependent methyltransferase [Nitrospira sp.]
MRLLAVFVAACANFVAALTDRLARVHIFLSGILPALLPPEQLARLMRQFYDHSYEAAGTTIPLETYSWSLEAWEERVVAEHMTAPGPILVLGAGLGRESLILADRGYRVLGLDLARRGLMIGTRRGLALPHPPTFVQADFLTIPIRPASVGTILIPGVMYSAVPGRARRQTWIDALHTCLKQDGRMILNFVIAREPETALTRSIRTVARLLRRLPGSNPDYQSGDTCTNGHFMHVFQTEQELRDELAGTRARLVGIRWTDGFAVLS